MKAVRVQQWGQPLQLEEIPPPVPGNEEVLVRVRASSVNPIDGIIAAGHMQAMYRVPMTLGTDFAGDVVAVGSEVNHVQPGDAVYGMSLQRGTFAEYAVVNASGVARMPRSLDYVQAAAVLVERSFNVLKPGGRYVTTIGEPSQEEAKKRGIEAHTTFTQPTVEGLNQIAELIDAGKLMVFVGRTFPLEEIQAAMEFKQEGVAPGKVGIVVS